MVVEIKEGDLVNGVKVVSVEEDPILPWQINIWLDDYEVDEFGDKSQKCIRVVT